MAIRITLAVIGIFTGVGIIGLAWNDNLGKAYDVLTGQTITASGNPPTGGTPASPPIHFPTLPSFPWFHFPTLGEPFPFVIEQ